jgi:hypothetical protein
MPDFFEAASITDLLNISRTSLSAALSELAVKTLRMPSELPTNIS